MTAHDDWASYLDPDTPPETRSELAAGMDPHEAAALDRIGGHLSEQAVWGEPSAGLRESLLAKATTEAAAEHAAQIETVPSGSEDDEFSRRRIRARRGAWMAGGLVAAAAAVVVAVLAIGPLFDQSDVATFEVAGTTLTPNLEATIDVKPLPAGVALTLHISGLPPAEEGTYYAAWLMPETGAMGDDEAMGGGMSDRPMVGVGSFHWREGGMPIGLWSGVDTDRFPIFVVTVQDENSPPVASDVVVMTGRLTDR